jgi:hypothetical protein
MEFQLAYDETLGEVKSQRVLVSNLRRVMLSRGFGTKDGITLVWHSSALLQKFISVSGIGGTSKEVPKFHQANTETWPHPLCKLQ